MPCDNHTLLRGEKSTLEFPDSVKHVKLCPIKKQKKQKLKGMKENNTVCSYFSLLRWSRFIL